MLMIVSASILMIGVDLSGIYVAVLAIKKELGLSGPAMVWVVNAYLIPYGSFLLLGGRLGDAYGHHRVFLLGIGLFTVASLCCGLSGAAEWLIGGRVVQGFGAAAAYSVAQTLALEGVEGQPERAKALGSLGVAGAVGGILGLVLCGALTDALSWRWIFLLNVPIGIVVLATAIAVLPRHTRNLVSPPPQVINAIVLTLTSMLTIYGAQTRLEHSAVSPYTLGCSVALLLMFIALELRARSPLLPVNLLLDGLFMTATLIGSLWLGSQLVCSYILTLFFQNVLHWTPMTVGLAFMPITLIGAVSSFKLSPFLTSRYGIKLPCAASLVATLIGIATFATMTSHVFLMKDILPGLVLIGLGTGVASNAIMLSALKNVPRENYGAAAGLLNGAANIAAAVTMAYVSSITVSNVSRPFKINSVDLSVLTNSYHGDFILASSLMAVALIVCGVFLHPDS